MRIVCTLAASAMAVIRVRNASRLLRITLMAHGCVMEAVHTACITIVCSLHTIVAPYLRRRRSSAGSRRLTRERSLSIRVPTTARTP